MAIIRLKKSSVTSNAPGTGDLAYGEIAINYADGRLYYKNSSNVIKNFIDSDLLVTNFVATNGSSTMTGTLDLGGNRILDVGTPSSGGDATNKTYVDTEILGSLAGVGALQFPTGIYGRVDSAAGEDAFGIATSIVYDCKTYPAGTLLTKDLGVLT